MHLQNKSLHVIFLLEVNRNECKIKHLNGVYGKFTKFNYFIFNLTTGKNTTRKDLLNVEFGTDTVIGPNF